MVQGAIAGATVVPIVLGLLVVIRSPQRVIGVLLLAQGLSVGAILVGGRLLPDGAWRLAVDQLAQGCWIFLFVWTALAAYLMPDGRLSSRRWRIWVAVGLGGAALFLLGAASDQGAFSEKHGGLRPPVPVLPEPAANVLGALGLISVVALLSGSVVAVSQRLSTASGTQRLQLLWLVWGASAVPAGLVVMWVNYLALDGLPWLGYVTAAVVSVALPSTIAIAIMRHQLFDIRLVLSRTLVYGALAISVTATYSVVVLLADRLAGSGTVGGLMAVVVVALAMHPLHTWLRWRVERWVYGYRSHPQRALRLLAERAEASEPEALIEAVTTAVAEALRVDRVWVESSASQGDERQVRLPLADHGGRIGDLVVEVPSGRRFSSADLSLLRDLARYAAVLVRSEQLRNRLGDSRAQLVAGREEERRRLRRDLHDGVGPSLAAIVLKLDAATRRTDEEQRALLVEAREEVRGAIDEIRRLVENLRPPAIDQVGLLGAIRQRAAALSGDVVIDVAGPEHMQGLPAAVEVAAYRIASESMTNVARHAHATRCQVDVIVNGHFELTVADNGTQTAGPDDCPGGGTGWTSMRERAAELGGECTITRTPDGGTLVSARLPLDTDRADEVDRSRE